MRYELNGKNINIPDKEIDKSMKLLDLTKEEAIEMWLEDEGYLDNDEQLNLEQKAKENKITATVHKAKSEKKERPKIDRNSELKKQVFREIYTIVKELAEENEYSVEILKENKLIELKVGEKYFKLDLIETKKKK